MLHCFIYHRDNCYSIVYTGFGLRHPAGFWCADAAIASACMGFLSYAEENKSLCRVVEAKTEKGYFSVTIAAKKGELYSSVAISAVFDALLNTLRIIEERYRYAFSLHIDEPVAVDAKEKECAAVAAY